MTLSALQKQFYLSHKLRSWSSTPLNTLAESILALAIWSIVRLGSYFSEIHLSHLFNILVSQISCLSFPLYSKDEKVQADDSYNET